MKVSPDPVAEKYLRSYAEATGAWAHYLEDWAPFTSAVVVPAYREKANVIRSLLKKVKCQGHALVILVVNQPEGASPEAHQINQELIRALAGELTFIRKFDGTHLSFYQRAHEQGGKISLALIDGTSTAYCLHNRDGVGRARKMGMDFALALYEMGLLTARFVGSSDADAFLPEEYFSTLTRAGQGDFFQKNTLKEQRTCSALLFPYEHIAHEDRSLFARMQEVEASFRYYVLGLAKANSPYAFHSLGSALAVSLPHYARVRGFPNRQAGEDFYVLGKLCKLAPMIRLVSPRVSIETRLSDRVPFGTGPSLQRAQELASTSSFLGYNPQAFMYLEAFLKVMTQAAEGGSLNEVVLNQLPAWAQQLGEKIWLKLAPHLQSCPSSTHRRRCFHDQFDALATLQFIHLAHERELNKVPLRDALIELGCISPEQSIQSGLASLRAQEEALPTLVGPA